MLWYKTVPFLNSEHWRDLGTPQSVFESLSKCLCMCSLLPLLLQPPLQTCCVNCSELLPPIYSERDVKYWEGGERQKFMCRSCRGYGSLCPWACFSCGQSNFVKSVFLWKRNCGKGSKLERCSRYGSWLFSEQLLTSPWHCIGNQVTESWCYASKK